MAVTDVVIDEIVATVRTVDSHAMLDPKLVRRLVQAVLAGTDERRERERRRKKDTRIGETKTPTSRRPEMPSPGQASLMVEWSQFETEIIDLQYNPTEIGLEKNVHIAEIPIPGLTAPLQQFVRGEAETLRLELFFDTSDQGMGLNAVSVITLTDQIYALSRIIPDQHTPPVVTFCWGPDFPGNELPPELSNQRRNGFTGMVTNFIRPSRCGAPAASRCAASCR